MILTAAAVLATPATAAITWADWTSADATGATGTLGAASITFDGGLHNWQTAGGADYWRSGGIAHSAYDAVSNLPANFDFVAPSVNGGTNTILFSETVVNPLIAIISLGQLGIQTNWAFDAPFTIVDQGAGHFGNGVFTVDGNTLSAGEAHGIIQFVGSFDSISFVSNRVEFWSGLTVGVEGFENGSVVPEPATWAMFIAGFGLVGAAVRRRRAAAA